MSKYNSFGNEMNEIKMKNTEPLFPLESPFSKKVDRGAVPLLDSTFVIRGGDTKERKATKLILDLIGDEPAMSSINQVRIDDDTDVPLDFEGDRTLIVSQDFLKGGPYESSVLMLATAYRMAHPEIEEGREYAYAKDVVEPKIKEKLRIERADKEKERTEVYQVGSDIQPEYEIDDYDGPEPYGPLEAKISVREEVDVDRVDDRDLMVGVSGLDTDNYKKSMEEQMKNNMYMGI